MAGKPTTNTQSATNTKSVTPNWVEVKKIIDRKEKVVLIIGTGKFIEFKFEVKRLKDKETRKEKISIVALHNEGKDAQGKDIWENYGELHTNIGELSTDIIKLNEYGINLPRKEFVDLAKVISDNFYHLPLEWKENIMNNVTEETVLEIVDYFKEVIKDNGIEEKNGCYSIPTEAFDKEYKESTFKVDKDKVKEALKLYGYTKCNPKRPDHSINVEGKRIRHISFIADKIGKVE